MKQLQPAGCCTSELCLPLFHWLRCQAAPPFSRAGIYPNLVWYVLTRVKVEENNRIRRSEIQDCMSMKSLLHNLEDHQIKILLD